MFDGVKSLIPILDAEKTALQIIQAIEKNKKIITIPILKKSALGSQEEINQFLSSPPNIN